MCGGALEILPCSRVGHLYRHSTYSYNGNREKITARNYIRVIEVWMDEYKRFFYASQRRKVLTERQKIVSSSFTNFYFDLDAQNVSPSDLTARKNLRKQLKCKNFRWYLENVYPESSWLKEYIMMGEVSELKVSFVNNQYIKCIQSKLGS